MGTHNKSLDTELSDPAGMIRRPLAIGCLRLSTEPDRDEGRAMAVLHAAFEAGVTLLDTADVYCRDDREIGHVFRTTGVEAP